MTDAFFTTADGCRLAYVSEGEGMCVLWQHGLGADRQQAAEVFPAMPGIRRITLECRGHGASDLGDVGRLSIAQFAEDALALLDHLGVARVVVGGISLGAAIALRIAALYPARVIGLLLARPAWVDAAGPAHLQAYRDVSRLLAAHGIAEGRRLFEEEPRLKIVEAASPDNAASLRWFFDRRQPASTITLLDRIPADGPGIDRAGLGGMDVPTLVIANGEDYVHSLATAENLAGLIPRARLTIITSKSVSRTGYVAEFAKAIRGALTLWATHA